MEEEEEKKNKRLQTLSSVLSNKQQNHTTVQHYTGTRGDKKAKRAKRSIKGGYSQARVQKVGVHFGCITTFLIVQAGLVRGLGG